MAVSKEQLLKATPQLVGQIDYSKVRLSPKEAFILSRIDGRSTVSDISKISAMNIDETLSSILSLSIKEVIKFKEFSLDQIKGGPSPKPVQAAAPRPAPSMPAAKPQAAQPPQKPVAQSRPPAPIPTQPVAPSTASESIWGTAPAQESPAEPESSTPAEPESSTPAEPNVDAENIQESPPAAIPQQSPAAPQRPAGAPGGMPRLVAPIFKRPEPKEDLSAIAESGTLKEITFPALIAKLSVGKVTGILRVTRKQGLGYKEIYLRGGNPVYVGGTYIIEKECLGQLLKITGKIADFYLQKSLEMVKEGKMQGESLIELGAINRKMLGSSIKWQSELKLAEIFTWREGEGSYELYRVGSFDRKFTVVEISVGALILKGIKRGFPFNIVEREIGARQNEYVIKKTGTELDPAGFNFQLPESRLFEKVIDGSSTIAEIIEKSQMDPKHVKQFLYVLMITQLVEIRNKPAAGSDEDKLLDDLRSRVGVAQKGTLFDALGIHWTSIGWKVQVGYDKLIVTYGPESKYQKSGVPEVIDCAKTILEQGRKAYDILIDKNKRVEYRKSLHNETKLQISSDLQFQQAESQLLWKEDYRSSVEILESAAELAPTNWLIQAAYGCALVKLYYPADREKVRDGENLVARSTASAPQNDSVHFFAGHAYWTMRNTSKARSEFETAIRINPGNTDAIKALRMMARQEAGG